MIRTCKSFAPLIAAFLLFSACDGGTVSPQESRVTIQLTDAPGDLKEAWVEITEIYLAGEGDDGRVMLRQGSTGLVDLLTLAGGKTLDLVQDAIIPAGTYSQLRFVIGAAYIVTEAGDVYATAGADVAGPAQPKGTLKCPSCGESGLKVNLPGGAVRLDDESTVLVVDFDVNQSFGAAAGQSGQWVMRPVMHASDFTASGTIAGSVTAIDSTVVLPESCGGQDVDLSRFVPTATSGEIVRSGVAEAAGTYKISFVAPGTYALGVAPVAYENEDSLFFSASAEPVSVAVESGKLSTAEFLVNSVTCKTAE